MDLAEIHRLVADDLRDGLGPAFVPAVDGDDAITHPRPFDDREPITNGTFTTVVWEYRARHADWFQGVPPTNRELTIRGTTIVDHRNDAKPLLHRYIDWLNVLYGIGMTMYHRVIVPEPNYDAMNNPQIPFQSK